MSKKTLVGIVAIVAVLIFVIWYARRQPSGNSQNSATFRVGAILPLTGPAASFGRSSQNAIILAQDDIKASNVNFPLEVKFEDSAADPKTALSAIERLHRLENTNVFISSVSGVTLALIPIVQRDGLLLFANAAHPDITKGGGNVFRYSNTVDSEAKAIADFIPTIKSQRIFCIASNDDYGKSYIAELQKLSQSSAANFQIIGTDLYDRTTTDFRTILAKAKESKPDAYIVIGVGNTLGLLVRQLRESGFNGPFIASLGFVVTPEALESAGEGMRGGYFLNYNALSDERVRNLRQRYQSRFGEDPSPSIILDYALVFILKDAWAAAGSEPAAMANFLRQQQKFETPIGTLTSSGAGNIIAPVHVQSVPSNGPINIWSDR